MKKHKQNECVSVVLHVCIFSYWTNKGLSYTILSYLIFNVVLKAFHCVSHFLNVIGWAPKLKKHKQTQENTESVQTEYKPFVMK